MKNFIDDAIKNALNNEMSDYERECVNEQLDSLMTVIKRDSEKDGNIRPAEYREIRTKLLCALIQVDAINGLSRAVRRINTDEIVSAIDRFSGND